MPAPDPRLAAAARLRAQAAWLGDLIAGDALPCPDACATAWRTMCDQLGLAVALESAARAEADARAAAEGRDLHALLRLDGLFPRPAPSRTPGAVR